MLLTCSLGFRFPPPILNSRIFYLISITTWLPIPMLNSERYNHIQASQAMIEQILTSHTPTWLILLLSTACPPYSALAWYSNFSTGLPQNCADHCRLHRWIFSFETSNSSQTVYFIEYDCAYQPIARRILHGTQTLRSKIKKSSKLDKNDGSPLIIMVVLLLNTGVPLKRYDPNIDHSIIQTALNRRSLHNVWT